MTTAPSRHRLQRPGGRRYRLQPDKPFGATVELPDPVDITLDTDPLKDSVG
ncbi:hypothetical protein [Streptomyces glaucescens]|uniref:hypothetical protein n=1 Tax=Streptomyces glaucescens TaxID=1907 RepID=UPI001B80C62E|nr:hypothetical protein [Streptomyces glaucescens]